MTGHKGPDSRRLKVAAGRLYAQGKALDQRANTFNAPFVRVGG